MRRFILIALALMGIIAGCNINTPKITAPFVKELILEPTDISVIAGEKRPFTFRALLDNGEYVNLTFTKDFTYKTLQSNMVTVESGYVYVDSMTPVNTTLKVDFVYQNRQIAMNIQVAENPLTAMVINDDGSKIVSSESRFDIIVNKEYHLSEAYAPEDLVIPVITFPDSYQGELEKMHLRQRAAEALEEMFKAAEDSSIELYAISGYRSYSLQERVFKYHVDRLGSEEEANKISARPGESEHQTGLAMDVSCESLNYKLSQEFANTPEGQWVYNNCADYGFILRYLEGKDEITGYTYEPWHLRYVGVDLAREIMSSGLTMEEYFEAIK